MNLNASFDAVATKARSFGYKSKINELIGAGLAFSLPISITATNVLLIIALAMICLDKEKYHELNSNLIHPVMLATYLYIGVVLISSLYSEGSLLEIVAAINKSMRLLYIPFLMVLYKTSIARERAIDWFLLAILGMIVFALFKKIFTIGGVVFEYESFKDRIFSSFFAANGVYIAMVLLINKKKYGWNAKRIFYLCLAGLGCSYLFLVSYGRTGQLVMVVLGGLLVLQHKGYRRYLITVLLSIMISAPFISNAMFDRYKQALSEYEKYTKIYQHYPGSCASTSVGLRLEFAINSLRLAKQNPWFGSGAGSFQKVYFDTYSKKNRCKSTNNPHNQYAYHLVEQGMLGVLALVGFFCVIICSAMVKLEPLYKTAVVGITVAMMVGCLFNSFLMDANSALFFIVMLSIFQSGYFVKDEKRV